MRRHFAVAVAVAVAVASLLLAQHAVAAPYLLVGIDQKQVWDDEGRAIYAEGGKDVLSLIDIVRPHAPRIVANLPVPNSIVGPPTNLAIVPGNKLAIVADSVNHVRQADGNFKQSPANRLYLVALRGEHSRVVQTLTAGLQPSGLSINRAGTLALVAYRGETAIGVLRIARGRLVELGRVDVGGKPSHVAIAPDGKTALVVKQDDDAVSVLDIQGEAVTYRKDLPTADGPYNVEFTADGQRGIISARGYLTVVAIDTSGKRVADTVKVGNGSEGLAISPLGHMIVSVALLGSNGAKNAADFEERGALVVLAEKGGKFAPVQQVKVGRVPEGVAFSPDGKFLYVANFYDSDLWVFQVKGQRLVDTGKRLALPGRPASMRGSSR